MAAIDKTSVPVPEDPSGVPLGRAVQAIAKAMADRGAHPAKVVVLAPFGQLLQLLKVQWAQTVVNGFTPRFETTRTWAGALAYLGATTQGADDFRADTAMDMLTARSLLERAGLGRYQDELQPRLLQCSTVLAPLAAAVAPAQRTVWLEQRQTALAQAHADREWRQDDTGLLRFEVAVTQLALVWAASSTYPTDVLHTGLHVESVDALIILDGLQADPLTDSMGRRWGDKTVRIPLATFTAPIPFADPVTAICRVLKARDFEEEAQWAAACVLRHLAARDGVAPVALVANDRSVTRRIRAMLESEGVAVQDATGWALSTTRAAASVMAALQAATWNASSDAVLDWLKNAPAVSQTTVSALESALRKARCKLWRQRPWGGSEAQQQSAQEEGVHAAVSALAARCQQQLQSLQAPRSLSRWQADWVAHLQACGIWQQLQQDTAGLAVVNALHWSEAAQFRMADWQHSQRRMRLDEYTIWVRSALEGSSYLPVADEHSQVVVMPLSQLLARPCFAVVIPGCDEIRLSAAPELAGGWTPAERAALGLPSRDDMTRSLHLAWRQALQCLRVDVLWRGADGGGEPLSPSPLVTMLGGHAHRQAQSPQDPGIMGRRPIMPQPGLAPQAKGQLLPITKLSSSAYEDLRRCPYRFFALRQLGLKEQSELDAELEKRDIGDWLHEVLKDFHQTLPALAPDTLDTRRELLDRCARQCREQRRFSDGDFLPYQAAWPAQRDGYLKWLEGHEASGARFELAESWHETGLGPITLVGRLDRVDSTGPARANVPGDGVADDLARKPVMVLDYKTESPSKSKARVKQPMEDTQLAFYAALLPHDSPRAAYLNVGERDGTQLFEQDMLVDARDCLIEGILDDMQRIAGGAVLAALGEGEACEYCAARGLCRKDFWETA